MVLLPLHFSMAARRGKWKARWFNDPSQAAQLYDLDVDVHEDVDVSADNPDVLSQMMADATAAFDVEDKYWPDVSCVSIFPDYAFANNCQYQFAQTRV